MSRHFDRLTGLADLPVPARVEQTTRSSGVRQATILVIDLERLRPDEQNVRQQLLDADIDEMAGSLRELGQQVPIKVRWCPVDSVWRIVQGNCRYRAAPRAGLTSLRAEVLDEHLSDEQVRIRQLAENTARRDLTPLDAARAMQDVLDRGDVTQEQLARQLGRSQSWVSRQLALLRLSAAEQAKVASGQKRMTEARAQVVSRPRGKGRAKPAQVRLRDDGVEVLIIWRKASARGTVCDALDRVRPLAEQADRDDEQRAA
jgi:ParB family chromosome partitioning protein